MFHGCRVFLKQCIRSLNDAGIINCPDADAVVNGELKTYAKENSNAVLLGHSMFATMLKKSNISSWPESSTMYYFFLGFLAILTDNSARLLHVLSESSTWIWKFASSSPLRCIFYLPTICHSKVLQCFFQFQRDYAAPFFRCSLLKNSNVKSVCLGNVVDDESLKH